MLESKKLLQMQLAEADAKLKNYQFTIDILNKQNEALRKMQTMYEKNMAEHTKLLNKMMSMLNTMTSDSSKDQSINQESIDKENEKRKAEIFERKH